MKRRDFVAFAGTILAFPRVMLAQQAAKLPRVAYVAATGTVDQMVETGGTPAAAAFIGGLRKNGLVEGRTVILERYSQNGQQGDLAASGTLARLIINSAPDVILGAATTNLALAVRELTRSIPFVLISTDVLAQGAVNNGAHPEANITGLSTQASEGAEGKNLALLAEAIPSARSIAYVWPVAPGNLASDGSASFRRAVTDAAARLGLVITLLLIDSPTSASQYRRLFADVRDQGIALVQFGSNGNFVTTAELGGQLALEARVPAISPFLPFAQSGGLLSYGANLPAIFARAADYVALILRGARPADLPVLQPTLFDFIVNLKTAKAIGITIPASTLVQATQVIE